MLFPIENPVKKIPDSHEITLQHGTKSVRTLVKVVVVSLSVVFIVSNMNH